VTRASGTSPLLIANAPGASEWRPDLVTMTDTLPVRASLSGLFTAVSLEPTPVLVLAWDMPFVTVPLLGALLGDGGNHDVFVPESAGPRGIEPLCGVYAPSCASAIRSCLEAGRLEANAFYGEVRTGTLPLETVRQFGDPAVLFFNVNTPEDLTEAQRIWAARYSGRP
jgi:molybdopterin-guanine dinucleotide biosynthesis protein A